MIGFSVGFTKWEIIKLHNKENVGAAKVLLEAMFKYCSVAIEVGIKNLKSSFYQMGGTSLNTIRVVTFLNDNDYPLSTLEPKCQFLIISINSRVFSLT